MSYATMQALLRQAEIDGWFGVGMIVVGLVLLTLVFPLMAKRARYSTNVELLRYVLAIGSIVLILYGAHEALWLMNPKGYVLAHMPTR
jgi:hypothetical protein